MMTIGLNMLGNMNKQATSQESLSMPFWRLLVASGILSIVIGFFNLVAASLALTPSPDQMLMSPRASSSATSHATSPLVVSAPVAP
jgi:hypothetical protein